MKGKVKWFNEKKGYGFITMEDERTHSFIFRPFRVKDLNPLTKGTKLNVKSLKVPKVLKLPM
jgi:cold shock CspA family protein